MINVGVNKLYIKDKELYYGKLRDNKGNIKVIKKTVCKLSYIIDDGIKSIYINNVEYTESGDIYLPIGTKVEIKYYLKNGYFIKNSIENLFILKKDTAITISSYSIAKKNMYEVGDVVVFNKDTQALEVFNTSDLDKLSPLICTTVGVIVVPSSHNIYGTNEAAFIRYRNSIKAMNVYSEHTMGQESRGDLFSKRDSIALTDFDSRGYLNTSYVVSDADVESNSIIGPYILVPVDLNVCSLSEHIKFSGIVASNADIRYKSVKTADYNSYYAAYSPYRNSRLHKNELFDKYVSSTNGTEVSSLIDGKKNTERLLDLATAQPNWKNESIIQETDIGYSPAACYVWKMSTEGTNKGDWYIPAIGELFYLFSKLSTIISTYNKIYQWRTNNTQSPYSITNFLCNEITASSANYFNGVWYFDIIEVNFDNGVTGASYQRRVVHGNGGNTFIPFAKIKEKL